ncbi:hypothetical protein WMF43_20580 [Sorangium sp. So ce131]
MVDFAQGKPRTFLLGDMRRMGTVSMEARRYFARSKVNENHGATALFGTTLGQRVLGALIIRAYGLLHPDTFEMALFEREEAARAWLAEQRLKLAHAASQ